MSHQTVPEAPPRRRRRLTAHAICLTALLATGITVPVALDAPSAAAVEACQSEVATYVLTPGSKTNTLTRYVDFDPKNGGVGGPLLRTRSAPFRLGSRMFTGGHGVIYEIAKDGTLMSHKDQTGSGGSLLTAARTYNFNWTTRVRVWSNGGRIFSVHEGGKLEVFKQSDPATGAGEITLLGTLPYDRPAVLAFKNADDVWASGNRIYTLKDGEIRAWDYSESGTTPVLPATGTLLATGLTTAVNGWSPGPGSVYTSDRASGSFVVRSYTGTSELTLARDDVAYLPYGDVFADTATCLSEPADAKPMADTGPTETEAPPEAVPDDSTTPSEPVDPGQFSGKFVLGDGRPAANMAVRIEATNVTDDTDTETVLTTLGTTTTAADGSWQLDVPDTLPESVSSAVAENGGAINAMATVMGKTPAGTPMRGVDHVAAAATSASVTAQALVATAAEDTAAPTPVLPLVADTTSETGTSDFSQSWASQKEAEPQETDDAPAPTWQSDASGVPTTDPYVVNGVDTKSQPIQAYDGGCDKTSEKTVDKSIYYTTVAEGHANWDVKATVDYDQKLATSVEVAVKTGSNWSAQGSVSLSSTTGVATGYTNRGPYFAKQWKVPIEYKKVKMTWKCGGNNTFTQYKIMGGKYKVPSGGATGKYGKDVRYKDGTAYYNSPKSHRAYVPRGSYFQLTKNRSIKWSNAVAAYGVSLSASTQYDREHKQRITAGTSTAARHDIWGKNDSVSGKPGVFYSF